MTEERVRLTVRLTVDLTSEEAELVKLLLLALKKEVAEKGSIKLGSTTVPNDLLRKLLPRIKSASL
jgi:hypothetical protein